MKLFAVLLAFVVSPTFFAQLDIPGEMIKVAAQSGFNALLVVLLLWMGSQRLDKLTARIEAALKEHSETVDRCSSAVNTVTLGLAFLPKEWRDTAARLNEEIQQAKQGRKQP